VEQRTGVSNAHLSQIERGAIRRPNPAILMNLAELYGLNYELVAEWSGYLEPLGSRGSSQLAGMALRLFVELDPVAQSQAFGILGEAPKRDGSRESWESQLNAFTEQPEHRLDR
jgi:transcriptional regulator with XRE-family HTH domain